jgi:hypothetical protein
MGIIYTGRGSTYIPFCYMCARIREVIINFLPPPTRAGLTERLSAAAVAVASFLFGGVGPSLNNYRLIVWQSGLR